MAFKQALPLAVQRFKRMKRIRKDGDNVYKSVSPRVQVIDDFNGNSSQKILSDIKPDIIIMGGTTIIRQHILDIPSIGILNAHTGLLPEYRGVNCLAWSIYNDDDIGFSIHYVDTGVDTGPIVTRRFLEISKDETLTSLYEKVYDVEGETIAEIVIDLMNGKDVPVTQQSISEGKQYYMMPIDMLREVDKKVREIARRRDLNRDTTSEL
jgi:methionyl-tRNA formyltransferase